MDTTNTIRIKKEDIEFYLPENPVIVEAGAHIGRDTVKMATRWPSSTIHAFEPVPYLFNQLQENTEKYNNIICYNYALSDSAGSQDIYISSDRSTAASSLLKPKDLLKESPDITFDQSVTVKTITLDQWSNKYGIPYVDLLWLDMQGNEYFALKSATQLLKTVSVIYTEISLTQRYEKQVLFKEYKQWLKSQNFKLVDYELSQETWGNALFINKF